MPHDNYTHAQLARATDAQHHLAAADAALECLITLLSTGVQTAVKHDVIAAHRRAHRTGRPAKIEADTDLRAFIIARIDTLTFDDLTSQIAVTFPPNRRVSRSSLHRWWQKWAGKSGAPIDKNRL